YNLSLERKTFFYVRQCPSFRSSSVVEQSAVNRSVVGSNPTCGAELESCPSWLKVHDWKSCRPFAVSRVQIPCSPYLKRLVYLIYGPLVKRLRHHPFTVVSRVRFPYGSPLFYNVLGGLAQLGEHLPYKQRVGGSSPSSSLIIPRGGAVW